MIDMLSPNLRSKFAISVHCFGYKVDHDFRGNPILIKILKSASSFGRYLSIIFCKIMIGENVKLTRQLWLSPKGNIIIGLRKIGNNSVIHHNVTLGMGLGQYSSKATPKLGNDVWIGPDSVIHGDIVIGDGATILAHSVVAKNIMPGCVVAGNPARIVKRNFDNKNLRFSSRHDINIDSINAEDLSNV